MECGKNNFLMLKIMTTYISLFAGGRSSTQKGGNKQNVVHTCTERSRRSLPPTEIKGNIFLMVNNK